MHVDNGFGYGVLHAELELVTAREYHHHRAACLGVINEEASFLFVICHKRYLEHVALQLRVDSCQPVGRDCLLGRMEANLSYTHHVVQLVLDCILRIRNVPDLEPEVAQVVGAP